MDHSVFRPGRRNRYAAPIGGVFIILCFVGFFTVASFCLSTTKNLLDNSKRKQEYERMLLPVVIFDPVPFENPVNIDNASLLQYSIWATALGEKREQYEYDDNNMMVIPASDIDVTAQRLFGPDVRLEHRSFGDLEDSYLYDEEIRSYHVPIITMTGFATPKVEEINKTSGDVIELKMGYVPPSTILDLDASGDMGTPEPQKYMIYELHRGKNGWYLYAIKDLPGADLLGGVDAMPDIGWDGGGSVSDMVPEVAGSNPESLPGDAAPEDGSSDGGSSAEGEEEAPGEGEDEDGEGGESSEDAGEGESPEDDSSQESAPEMQG